MVVDNVAPSSTDVYRDPLRLAPTSMGVALSARRGCWRRGDDDDAVDDEAAISRRADGDERAPMRGDA